MTHSKEFWKDVFWVSVFTILMMMFCSCGDSRRNTFVIHEETDRLLVIDVDTSYDASHMNQCIYRLQVAPSGGKIYMYDTCGKYVTGQVLNR